MTWDLLVWLLKQQLKAGQGTLEMVPEKAPNCSPFLQRHGLFFKEDIRDWIQCQIERLGKETKLNYESFLFLPQF